MTCCRYSPHLQWCTTRNTTLLIIPGQVTWKARLVFNNQRASKSWEGLSPNKGRAHFVIFQRWATLQFSCYVQCCIVCPCRMCYIFLNGSTDRPIAHLHARILSRNTMDSGFTFLSQANEERTPHHQSDNLEGTVAPGIHRAPDPNLGKSVTYLLQHFYFVRMVLNRHVTKFQVILNKLLVTQK